MVAVNHLLKVWVFTEHYFVGSNFYRFYNKSAKKAIKGIKSGQSFSELHFVSKLFKIFLF